jgi:hypothetical protein
MIVTTTIPSCFRAATQALEIPCFEQTGKRPRLAVTDALPISGPPARSRWTIGRLSAMIFDIVGHA